VAVLPCEPSEFLVGKRGTHRTNAMNSDHYLEKRVIETADISSGKPMNTSQPGIETPAHGPAPTNAHEH
jgi:hypothetical protein